MATITKADRRRLAAAFRKAQCYLSDDCPYVCWALEDVYAAGRIDHRTYTLARSLISYRLDGCTYVTAWLFDATGGSLSMHLITEHELEYRKLWLDALIKEFEQ